MSTDQTDQPATAGTPTTESQDPIEGGDATPELGEGEDDAVVIRMASVVADYLATADVGVDGLHQALEAARVRRAGRGATHLVSLERSDAQRVLDHLTERLRAERPGIGIPRWRLDRAVRMIADDLST